MVQLATADRRAEIQFRQAFYNNGNFKISSVQRRALNCSHSSLHKIWSIIISLAVDS